MKAPLTLFVRTVQEVEQQGSAGRRCWVEFGYNYEIYEMLSMEALTLNPGTFTGGGNLLPPKGL